MADSTRLIDLFQPAATVGNKPKARDTAAVPLAARNDARSRDTQSQAALDRLDSVLGSGATPRTDAPRGTYLNITV